MLLARHRQKDIAARLCAVVCAVLALSACADSSSSSDGERAQSIPESSDLSSLSVDESRSLRGEAARAAQLELQRCLEERGFPGQMAADGSLQIEVGGQHEAYHRASEECDQEVDYGAAAAPLAEPEIRWLYDENIKAYDCLVANGFSPAEPVSFGVFLADYQEGRPPWTPFLTAQSNAPIMTESCPEPDINAQE